MPTTLECTNCNKTYHKKSSFEKHIVWCNFRLNSKKEQQEIIDDIEDTPPYDALVNIVQMMHSKMLTLEQKIVKLERQQVAQNKKKKTVMLEWLTLHMSHPDCHLAKWLEDLRIDQTHFVLVFEDSLIEAVTQLLSDNSQLKWPIVRFAQQKQQIFVATMQADNSIEWKTFEPQDMNRVLNHIQHKLLQVARAWKLEHKHALRTGRLEEQFNVHGINRVLSLSSLSSKQREQFLPLLCQTVDFDQHPLLL